jgi:hypothetical protein
MDLETFKEYIRIHLISLQQDSEELEKQMGFIDDLDSDEYKDLELEDVSTTGQMLACYHLLSVLEGNSDER